METEIYIVYAIIAIVLGFIASFKYDKAYKNLDEDKLRRECENNVSALCFFVLGNNLPVYCLDKERREKICEASIYMMIAVYMLIFNPIPGGEGAVIILFVFWVLVVVEIFRIPYIISRMADAGFENDAIDKFTNFYCKKIIVGGLIYASIYLPLVITDITGYVMNENAYKKLNNYHYGESISFLSERSKKKLMEIIEIKSLKDERFKELINSVHYIKDKYVYAPLFSMFMKKTDKRKDEDMEDVVKRVFYKRKYGWKIIIISEIIRFLILLIPYYFLIYRANVRFYEKESKKIFKKTGKREILRSAEKMKKYEKSMIIFVIIFMFLSTRHNSAGCWRTADVLLRVHYSIITGKKLSSLSDKIKKLNIKTDKQLSEAIHEGKISVSNVLDSTLTVQIEDSSLKKNIKKELLDYYRDNYEKYRYRIINGYLIDFIHGKYKKISEK